MKLEVGSTDQKPDAKFYRQVRSTVFKIKVVSAIIIVFKKIKKYWNGVQINNIKL